MKLTTIKAEASRFKMRLSGFYFKFHDLFSLFFIKLHFFTKLQSLNYRQFAIVTCTMCALRCACTKVEKRIEKSRKAIQQPKQPYQSI